MYHENRVDLGEGERESLGKWLGRKCFEWFESLIHAIIVVVFLMSFVFRAVNVSGESMMNTLRDNDKIIISMWNYTPKNGDIVVVRHGQKVESPLIKRIIALGGQRLSIDFKKGTVRVDAKLLNEPYLRERMWLRGDAKIPEIVPEGYAFVMGDNRNNSTDSRFEEVGLIPYEDIVGKASYIIYPFDRMGKI